MPTSHYTINNIEDSCCSYLICTLRILRYPTWRAIFISLNFKYDAKHVDKILFTSLHVGTLISIEDVKDKGVT